MPKQVIDKSLTKEELLARSAELMDDEEAITKNIDELVKQRTTLKNHPRATTSRLVTIKMNEDREKAK